MAKMREYNDEQLMVFAGFCLSFAALIERFLCVFRSFGREYSN
jgi:hypothetical protein